MHFSASYSVEADAATILDGLKVSVGFEPAVMASEELITSVDFKVDVVLARMITGPIGREPRQSHSANTLAAATGELSNLQYLVSDLVTALLMRRKQEDEDKTDAIIARRSSRRRMQRQEAEKQGHVGGKAVLTRVWHQQRFRVYGAPERYGSSRKGQLLPPWPFRVQFVGLCSVSDKKTLSSKLYEKSLEDSHRSRVRSLRSKERELMLIKQIPGSEFLNFDRMRREGSAKIIQRSWRLKSLTREFEGSGR